MEEIRLSKKEIQSRLNRLRIKPKGLEPRKYGVTTKYFIKDETQWNKRVDYEAIVSMNINNGIGDIIGKTKCEKKLRYAFPFFIGEKIQKYPLFKDHLKRG